MSNGNKHPLPEGATLREQKPQEFPLPKGATVRGESKKKDWQLGSLNPETLSQILASSESETPSTGKVNVASVLEENKDVPFVKRILNPDEYPVVENADGTVSSHLMSYSEADGKYFVYPTLVDKGQGRLEKPDDPYQEARDTGNVIKFDNEEDAAAFAAGSWKEKEIPSQFDSKLAQYKNLSPEIPEKAGLRLPTPEEMTAIIDKEKATGQTLDAKDFWLETGTNIEGRPQVDNWLEYVFSEGYNQSTIGLVDNIINGRERINIGDYEAGTLEGAVAFAISMAMDSPLFIASGGAGGIVAKGTARGAVKAGNVIGKKLITKGVETKLGNKVVQKGVEKFAERIGKSGAALGFYFAEHEALNQMVGVHGGVQTGKRVPWSDIDWGVVRKEGYIGTVLGAGIGVVGTTGAMLEGKVLGGMAKGLGRVATKAGLKIGEFATEVTLFVYGDAALRDNRKLSDVTLKDWFHTAIIILTLKGSGAAQASIGKMLRAPQFEKGMENKNEFEVIFSPEELEILNMGKNTSEVMDKIDESYMAKGDKEFSEFARVLANEDVPFVTKEKLLWALEGVRPKDRQEITRVDVEQREDGKSFMKLYNHNGVLLDVKEYSTLDRAKIDAASVTAEIIEQQNRQKAAELSPVEMITVQARLDKKNFNYNEFNAAQNIRAKYRNPEERKVIQNFIDVVDEVIAEQRKWKAAEASKESKTIKSGSKEELEFIQTQDVNPEIKLYEKRIEKINKIKEEGTYGEMVTDKFSEGKVKIINEETANKFIKEAEQRITDLKDELVSREGDMPFKLGRKGYKTKEEFIEAVKQFDEKNLPEPVFDIEQLSYKEFEQILKENAEGSREVITDKGKQAGETGKVKEEKVGVTGGSEEQVRLRDIEKDRLETKPPEEVELGAEEKRADIEIRRQKELDKYWEAQLKQIPTEKEKQREIKRRTTDQREKLNAINKLLNKAETMTKEEMRDWLNTDEAAQLLGEFEKLGIGEYWKYTTQENITKAREEAKRLFTPEVDIINAKYDTELTAKPVETKGEPEGTIDEFRMFSKEEVAAFIKEESDFNKHLKDKTPEQIDADADQFVLDFMEELVVPAPKSRESRIDFTSLNLQTRDLKAAKKNILAGKETKVTKRIKEKVKEWYKDGFIPTLEGSGGHEIEYGGVPVRDVLKSITEAKTSLTAKDKLIESELSEVLREQIEEDGITLENIDQLQANEISVMKGLGFKESEVKETISDYQEIKQYLENETKNLTKEGTPAEERVIGEGKTADNIEEAAKANRELAREDITKADVLVKSGFNLFGIDVTNEGIKRTWHKYFTSKGLLPQKVFDLWLKSKGNIRARLKDIDFTKREFAWAARKTYGKTILGTPKIDKAEREKINRVLEELRTADRAEILADMPEGVQLTIETKEHRAPAEVLKQVPEGMHEILIKMRNQIDALSREMVKEGIVEGDLAMKFMDNLGYYLTRTYRKHNDKDWKWEKIPDEIKNRAYKVIKDELPTATDAEIEGIMRGIVSKDSPFGIINSGKLGTKDLGILQRRKSIPEAIRALMGEYKDPLYNYATSIGRSANLIEKSNFLRQVKETGLNKFLFNKPKGEFSELLAAEGSDVMSPLNGLYTTRDIKEAFEQFEASEITSSIGRLYMKANAGVKYGKTILSVQTHVRNYISWPLIHLAGGRNPFGFLTTTGREIRNKVTERTKKEITENRKEYVKELLEYNILDESVWAGEMHDVMKDSFKYYEDFDRAGDNFLKKIGKGGLQLAEKFYKLEDNVHKIYAYEYEKERYRRVYEKKYPNKSVEEIELMTKQKASAIVTNTTPTYSMVPRSVKAIRRLPIVGTFVSFPAEIFRTTWNTAELIKNEYKDPDTRHIANTRLAGMISAAIVVPALSLASRIHLGIGRDEDRDMRRFFPEWSEDSDPVFLSNNKAGVYTYIDAGYSDPHNYIRKVLNPLIKDLVDLVSGKEIDFKDTMIESIKETFQPFLGEELLYSKVVDIQRNSKKGTGSPVYNEQGTAGEQAAEIVNYMWEGVKPGTLVSAERIKKAAKGRLEGSSQYKLSNEIIAVSTGQRISTLNVGEGFSWKVYRGGKDLAEARRIYTSKYKNETLDQKEIDRAYDSANKSLERVVGELHKDYKAAIRLGVKPEVLDEHIDKLFMGSFPANKTVKEAIKTGKFTPMDKEAKFISGEKKRKKAGKPLY